MKFKNFRLFSDLLDAQIKDVHSSAYFDWTDTIPPFQQGGDIALQTKSDHSSHETLCNYNSNTASDVRNAGAVKCCYNPLNLELKKGYEFVGQISIVSITLFLLYLLFYELTDPTLFSYGNQVNNPRPMPVS